MLRALRAGAARGRRQPQVAGGAAAISEGTGEGPDRARLRGAGPAPRRDGVGGALGKRGKKWQFWEKKKKGCLAGAVLDLEQSLVRLKAPICGREAGVRQGDRDKGQGSGPGLGAA